MDHTPRSTSPSAQGPRLASPSIAAPLTLTREDQQRQLRRLQHWRQRIEAEGYQTMLSVVPPCGLIVRDRAVDDRWLALAPNRSLAFFQRDATGHVACQHYTVDALGLDSEDASALVASATVRRFLQRDRA